MFDIGAAELLVIVIVAVLVIGPKDMPAAMRVAGRWIGKVRKISSHFRTGVDAMVREAELEDMEAKWKAQNKAIMDSTGSGSQADTGAPMMTGPPPTPETGAVEPITPEDRAAGADGAPPLPASPAPPSIPSPKPGE